MVRNEEDQYLGRRPLALHLEEATRRVAPPFLQKTCCARTSGKKFQGKKRCLVIGSGIGGLTVAYELLKQGMNVTVLEARGKTGGRCLTLRAGDEHVEDDNDLLESTGPRVTQKVDFEEVEGDEVPYFNAGPGRIPSAHTHLLGYLKEFKVELEVYVMNSTSNLVQMKNGPLKNDEPLAYRHVDHSVRGHLAELVYEKAEDIVEASRRRRKGRSCCCCSVTKKTTTTQTGRTTTQTTTTTTTTVSCDEYRLRKKERAGQLRDLMRNFGQLDGEGRFWPTGGENGLEHVRDRVGYAKPPGVDAGQTLDFLSLEALLE